MTGEGLQSHRWGLQSLGENPASFSSWGSHYNLIYMDGFTHQTYKRISISGANQSIRKRAPSLKGHWGLRNVTGPAGHRSQDPSNQSRRSSMTGGHRGNGRTDRLYRTPSPDTTTESSDICNPSHGGAHSSCGCCRRRKSESSYTKLLCSLFTCLWRSSSTSSSSELSLIHI